MPINVNNIKNKSDKDDVLRKIPLTPETNQGILEINSVKDFWSVPFERNISYNFFYVNT